jgi:hypothetical protein
MVAARTDGKLCLPAKAMIEFQVRIKQTED